MGPKWASQDGDTDMYGCSYELVGLGGIQCMRVGMGPGLVGVRVTVWMKKGQKCDVEREKKWGKRRRKGKEIKRDRVKKEKDKKKKKEKDLYLESHEVP